MGARNSKSERTNIYIPSQVKTAGFKLADDRHLSFSQLVTQLIERQLENEDDR